jgi:EmrB/QacA subfamily drug resistance transporter
MDSVHSACDSAVVRSSREQPATKHPYLILVGTILASSLAFVDGSVVNVALSAIAQNFTADSSSLQWVINAYLLPLSALLLLGGAAGDHFGRRRLLIIGTAMFAAGSLACSLSPSLRVLQGSRLLQGVGAAMLMPNSLAILGQTFRGESKGRVIGIWAATGAAMGAIGPVLGGWLIDLGSWRAIFLLNLPLAAGAIALAWAFVPVDHTEGRRPLDGLGGLLATVALAALTWALTVGSGAHGWTVSSALAAITAICLGLAFLNLERARGDRAMMPLSLFASRSFVGLTLFTFLLYGALGELFVVVPYFLIRAAAYSATQAGAALIPLPLILTVSSPFAGAFAGRIGPRIPLTLGPLVVAAGFMLSLRIGAGANYWTAVLPMIVVIGLGMSGAVAPLTTAVLTSVDPSHTGSASGLNSAVARTGGLVATALLGTVLGAAGAQLVSAFHAAMIAGAIASCAAAFSAFALLGSRTASA